MKEQLKLDPEETPFEFPCRFPIKVMGEKNTGIEELVAETLKHQLKNKHNIEFASRLSSGEKYISITATFTASSKKEIDAIFNILSENKKVKWMI